MPRLLVVTLALALVGPLAQAAPPESRPWTVAFEQSPLEDVLEPYRTILGQPITVSEAAAKHARGKKLTFAGSGKLTTKEARALLETALATHGLALRGAGPFEVVLKETTMATPAPHQHHGIDYIEFTVTDMAAAKRFYGAAFGWEFNDYGPDYAGIKRPGGEAGGLRLDTRVQRGGPLVVLYSNDLDATVKSVQKAGGKVTKPPFTFPGGRRFHLEDPSGNELAVWTEK